MSTVAQLVAQIAAAPAPVVFLDTCAILDVARAPAREQSASVPAADDLRALAGTVPPTVYLVVADVVGVEWDKNLDAASAEMDHASPTFEHFLRAFAPAALVTVNLAELGSFRELLKVCSEAPFRECRQIERDPAAANAALDRVVSERRPSHKKEVKDSYILEHCLAVARGLVDRAPYTPVPPMVFVSSNMSDFAENKSSTVIHRDLRADFTAAGLTYAVSIASAVALLRDGGHIP